MTIRSNTVTAGILLLKNVVETIAMAILTSYIFAYILSREPKLVFPDKLVIRHRTSWESKDKITLGILVGNKSRYNINNVVGCITCSYIKQEEPLLINSECTLKDERMVLENYYRFSFDLTQFPRQVLKDIIEKPEYSSKETIVVSITGNCNYIGNSFKITKRYTLSDIVFDEHEPEILKKRKNILTGEELINPFNGKKIKKIDWNEMHKIIEVDEDRRKKSVDEIRYIIKNMKREKK